MEDPNPKTGKTQIPKTVLGGLEAFNMTFTDIMEKTQVGKITTNEKPKTQIRKQQKSIG